MEGSWKFDDQFYGNLQEIGSEAAQNLEETVHCVEEGLGSEQ